jgi:hypothetical protein
VKHAHEKDSGVKTLKKKDMEKGWFLFLFSLGALLYGRSMSSAAM